MRAQKTASDQRTDHEVPELGPPRGSGLYLATWAVLAVSATGYMATLLLQPEWAAPLTTQALRTEEPPAVPYEAVEQLSDEVVSLRNTIADLQRELTEVKSKAEARQDVVVLNQEASPPLEPPAAEPQQEPESGRKPLLVQTVEIPAESLSLRTTQSDPPVQEAVRDDEPHPAKQAAAIQPELTPEPQRDSRKPEPARSADAAPREPPKPKQALAPPPPPPVKKVVVLNARPASETTAPPAVTIAAPSKQQQASPLATGSLPPAAPAITFGPPTVTPASESFAILLDAGPSLDALRLRWSVLHDRHQSALRNLEARYLVNGTPAAPSYELLAGPITSVEEASRICALLRARSVICSVGGPFTGNAL